jgi:undecaprenyl-diphosphatase
MSLLDQLLQSIILGLIQGLAEWLPISSTAHLKIAEHFFGLTGTPLLNVTLHVGTLFVVVFYFRHDVKNILVALVHHDFKSEHGSLIPLMAVATIPTGVIGVLYSVYLGDAYQTLLIIGITFLIGATFLHLSKTGNENASTVTLKMALIIGAAQGFASFPGLSRSGATISTGLLLGLKRDRAFKFSFLVSIPAILGNLAFEGFQQRGQFALQTMSSMDIFAGVVVAMITGYIAIRLISKLVRSKKFHYFAAYTWPLGAVLIIIALAGLWH